MVKHIILWKLREDLTEAEKETIKAGIKAGLEALKGYATHPAHVAVADTKVRPYTALRTCLDYEY